MIKLEKEKRNLKKSQNISHETENNVKTQKNRIFKKESHSSLNLKKIKKRKKQK